MDLVRYEGILEKVCFESLSKRKSGIHGAKMKGKTDPDAIFLLSESLSV